MLVPFKLQLIAPVLSETFPPPVAPFAGTIFRVKFPAAEFTVKVGLFKLLMPLRDAEIEVEPAISPAVVANPGVVLLIIAALVFEGDQDTAVVMS